MVWCCCRPQDQLCNFMKAIKECLETGYGLQLLPRWRMVLAIVAAIARMHGGRIMAESNGGVTSIGLTVPDPFKPSAPHPEAATR